MKLLAKSLTGALMLTVAGLAPTAASADPQYPADTQFYGEPVSEAAGLDYLYYIYGRPDADGVFPGSECRPGYYGCYSYYLPYDATR